MIEMSKYADITIKTNANLFEVVVEKSIENRVETY